ncbi:MAG: hypothetical protein GF400_10240 [Candidatus Eisenbacteria bacterium]|nr:hypothetical protein [Candidatus Eisenbacteria bacterium]
MSDDTKYAYAVARVRGMETRLFTRQIVERLLAESVEGVLSTLADTTYQEALADVSRPEDLERGLLKALSDTFATLAAMSPEPELIGLFRERWDFRNLRALLKASALKTETDEIGVAEGPGLVELPVIEKAVHEKSYGALPDHMAEAARTAEEEYRDLPELWCIDRVIDGALWRRSLSVAREHGNIFLEDYFKTEIDLHNIRTFVRVKEGGGDPEALDRALVDGGTLERSRFAALLDEPVDAFARSIEYGRYAPLAEVLRDWSSERMPDLERASDDFLLRMTERASTTAYGIEPLVRYILVKELEIKLVRTIVTGKLDAVDRSEVESRLRSLHA